MTTQTTPTLSTVETALLQVLHDNDASDNPDGLTSNQANQALPESLPLSQVGAALKTLYAAKLIRRYRGLRPDGTVDTRRYRLRSTGRELLQELGGPS